MATPRPSAAPIAAASASSPWPRRARRARSRLEVLGLTVEFRPLIDEESDDAPLQRDRVRSVHAQDGQPGVDRFSADLRERVSGGRAGRGHRGPVGPRRRPRGGSAGIRARASVAARSRGPGRARDGLGERPRPARSARSPGSSASNAGTPGLMTRTQSTSRAARSRRRGAARRGPGHPGDSACWSSPSVATAGRRA